MNRQLKPTHSTAGFTLLELLLVIAIMAVLTTMSLAVMNSASEDSKGAATQATLSKVESLMRVQVEAFEVRRLPIRTTDLGTGIPDTDPVKLVMMRNRKDQLIADMICAEMPRPYDTTGNGSYMPVSNCNGTSQRELGAYPVENMPSIPAVLMTKLQASPPAMVNRWRKIFADNNAKSNFNLPAEYLYEIVRGIDFDGVSGLESIGQSSIGDSDQDGFLEIVDAWGAPLDFQILQLNASKEFGKEVYRDGTGFVGLDTKVPRSLDKLRFVITSPNMPTIDPQQ